MKTKAILFLAVCCLIVHNSYSQFYGQIRHFTDSCQLTSGTRVTLNGHGYLMAGVRGVRQNVPSARPDFVIHRTDANGAITNPAIHFSKVYQIIDDVTCGPAVFQNNCNGVCVIETGNHGNGEAYALAGVYYNGLFFASLDAQGNVINTNRWVWPAGGWNTNKVFIRQSTQNPGNYYICGDYAGSAYVFRVNPAGVITWGGFFTNSAGSMWARALVEHPTLNEVAVVGQMEGMLACGLGATAGDGMFLRLNSLSGAVLTYANYNVLYDGDEDISSINLATDGFGNYDGYVIGGHTYHPLTPQTPFCCTAGPILSCARANNIDPIFMGKLDFAGNVQWSNKITRSGGGIVGGSSIYTTVSDVFERINPFTSLREYYGVADIGSTTVFKLDQFGNNSITPNEFSYAAGGVAGYAPRGTARLSKVENTTNDGFRAFSPYDLHLVGSYFNGVSGCGETLSNIFALNNALVSVSPLPGISFIPASNICPGNFNLNVLGYSPGSITYCSAPTVGGGSNLRPAAPTALGEQSLEQFISLLPNPSNGQVQLSINGFKEGEPVNLSLINSVGQLVLSKNYEGHSEAQQIQINLKETGLAPGIYYVDLKIGEHKQQFKLMYVD